jgi:hypothetical protein
MPAVSTLNNPTATVVANAAIVPAGTGGDVKVYTSSRTDLLIDINGYFAAPGTGGLSMSPWNPCRVLDTRLNGPPTGPTDVGSIDAYAAGLTQLLLDISGYFAP